MSHWSVRTKGIGSITIAIRNRKKRRRETDGRWVEENIIFYPHFLLAPQGQKLASLEHLKPLITSGI